MNDEPGPHDVGFCNHLHHCYKYHKNRKLIFITKMQKMMNLIFFMACEFEFEYDCWKVKIKLPILASVAMVLPSIVSVSISIAIPVSVIITITTITLKCKQNGNIKSKWKFKTIYFVNEVRSRSLCRSLGRSSLGRSSLGRSSLDFGLSSSLGLAGARL